MRFLLFWLIFISLTPFGLSQETSDTIVIATIETETDENGITFIPLVQNKTQLHNEYNYLLLVKKTDEKNNLSLDKQSGKFTLTPNEIKKLSTIHLNKNPKTNLKALLYIRDENQNLLIAKDSVEINFNELSAPIKETSLMPLGILVDDTKTKFGKDYYDSFFSTYIQLPSKFDFIVQVSEMPHRGQTSIIQVIAENEVVYEFFSKPDEEYIKYQVSQTLRSLQQLAQGKSLKNEFKY
jgi:hypothetical protein